MSPVKEKRLREKIEWASEHNIASLTFPIEELEDYARLEDFWNDLVIHIVDHWGLEYDEFLDLAEAFKLIRHEEYDPEKHGEDGWADMEEGDAIWLNNLQHEHN